MKVSEIMNTAPVTVYRDTPVDTVARLLVERQAEGAAVIEDDGRLVGMITEEDLIVRNANLHLPTYLNFLDGLFPVRGRHEFADEMRHMLATRADEVTSEHLYSVTPETDVADAATVMVEKHANPLPVLQDGRLVGTISHTDILRLMVREATAVDGGESGDA